MPRPIVVATAAPVTPSRGTGPTPKMNTGPRTMLMPLASQSVRMVSAASPAPRKAALIEKQQDHADAAGEDRARVARANRLHRGRCAHEREQVRSGDRSEGADDEGHADAEHHRLRGGARRARCILGAGSARDHRADADRQAHRAGVDDRHQALGQADRRDGIGAQHRHPEDVDDGEDRLGDHLQDHRDRDQEHRASERHRGQIAARAGQCFAHRRPESRFVHQALFRPGAAPAR